MLAAICRIKVGEKQYMDAFNDELEAFKGRVKDRAKARIEAAMAELEAVSIIFINMHYYNL